MSLHGKISIIFIAYLVKYCIFATKITYYGIYISLRKTDYWSFAD